MGSVVKEIIIGGTALLLVFCAVWLMGYMGYLEPTTESMEQVNGTNNHNHGFGHSPFGEQSSGR